MSHSTIRKVAISLNAISRVAVIVVIIVIIVIAGAAAVLATSKSSTTTTTPISTSTSVSSSSSISSISSSSTSSSSSSTATSITSVAPSSTLTVDEALISPLGESPFAATFFVTGSNWWLESVYQTLVTEDGNVLYQNGTVVAEPDLAQNWTVAPNGELYTFHLRQNVNFSNGDPFNCYQVWAGWYNTYWVEGNNSAFAEGYPVFNFSNVNFGLSTVDMMNGTGIINPSPQLLAIMQNSTWPFYCADANTLMVQTQAPFAFTPLLFVQFTAVMIDSQFVINNGGFGTPATGFNTAFNTEIIPGTGPYTITKYVPNTYEEFQQNPNYWGANLTAAQIQVDPYLDPGHYKTIFVYYKTDDLVRYTDLASGTAQIATIYAQDWPLIQQNPSKFGVANIPSESMIIEGVGMNTLRYPTNITLVRQAIVHAINYTDLAAKVFFGQWAPLVGPEYAAFSQFYDLGNLPPYSYNLTLAEQDLNESGVNVANLPTLDFDIVAGCGVCISGAQVIQADLGVIGIPVSVNVIPAAELAFPYVAGYGPYQISVANYSQQEAQFTWMGFPTYAPNEPTPADAWIAFVSDVSGGGNYANYGNSVVQACVNALVSSANQTFIRNVCTTANERIYNDTPYIWLATPKLAFGSGSVAYDKSAISSLLMDPSFTGESTTAILNTVVPAS